MPDETPKPAASVPEVEELKAAARETIDAGNRAVGAAEKATERVTQTQAALSAEQENTRRLREEAAQTTRDLKMASSNWDTRLTRIGLGAGLIAVVLLVAFWLATHPRGQQQVADNGEPLFKPEVTQRPPAPIEPRVAETPSKPDPLAPAPAAVPLPPVKPVALKECTIGTDCTGDDLLRLAKAWCGGEYFSGFSGSDFEKFGHTKLSRKDFQAKVMAVCDPQPATPPRVQETTNDGPIPRVRMANADDQTEAPVVPVGGYGPPRRAGGAGGEGDVVCSPLGSRRWLELNPKPRRPNCVMVERVPGEQCGGWWCPRSNASRRLPGY